MMTKSAFSSSLLSVISLIVIQCAIFTSVAAANDTAADFFNDPNIVQDWIFRMINIYPVWERGIFGKGIRIRINDEGVDYRHEEFQGRFDTESSCKIFDAYFDASSRTYRNHGTIVASIMGASGNNGQCAVGIAPQVTLQSCAIVGAPILDRTAMDHSYPKYNLQAMDISHNSLGYVPCRRQGLADLQITFDNFNTCPFTYRADNIFSYNGTLLQNMKHPCDVCEFPPPADEKPNDACSTAAFVHCQFYFEYDQEICLKLLKQVIVGGECSFQNLQTIRSSIETGATQGRNGKGVIYVYAAGNDFFNGDNANFENFGRFPILVGAVGKDGQHASYSTSGSNLLVTAPAGDFDNVDRQTVARAGGGCMLSDDGTSFSSPIVSGIIALMLEINPDLSWRDVQGILVTTSTPVTHTLYEDKTRTVNGAGLVHSNLYGFGIVNALEAVTAAENWKKYGPEQLIVQKAMDLNLKIPDDATPLVTQLQVGSGNPPIFVENVEVLVYLKHLTRGHLQILLRSPSGTVSELVPGFIPENGNTETEPWILRTVKNWGEVPEGTWSLEIIDTLEGDLSSCVDKPIQILNSGFTFGCNTMELLPRFHNEGFMEVALNLFDQGVSTGCCACTSGGSSGGAGSLFCNDSVDSNLCNQAVRNGVCANGALMPELTLLSVEDANGLSLKDACCVFGGGTTYQDTSFFRDQLVGWELNIYGHPDPTKTESPTTSPTSSPPTLVAAPPATSGGDGTSVWGSKTWVLATTLGFVVAVVSLIV